MQLAGNSYKVLDYVSFVVCPMCICVCLCACMCSSLCVCIPQCGLFKRELSQAVLNHQTHLCIFKDKISKICKFLSL